MFMSRPIRLPKKGLELPVGPRGFAGADGADPTDAHLLGLMSSLLPARYAAVHITDAAGDLAVTWPAGLFASAPVLSLTVQGAIGNEFACHLVGAPTTTGCVVKVRKFGALSFALTGLLVLDLLVAPGATRVHVTAESVT